MLTGCGRMLGCSPGTGNTSVALPVRGGLPSKVKKFPLTFWPVPSAAMASASSCVIVAHCAVPSGRGGATGGTRTSLIIHPSYQPDSLLMTNSPETSVNMSMNAPGSAGAVGGPGFGHIPARDAPMVGRPPLAALAAVGMAVSLIPGILAVNTFG